MKIKEFDTYQAVYCGLCKQLGELYGPFSKLTLNYDFTFLALISLGMQQDWGQFRKESCAANPLKKKACLVSCEALSFSASAAMVMFYYKLQDNYQDGGWKDKTKTTALRPFAASVRKKIPPKYRYLDQIVADCMKQQAEVEQSDSLSIDRAAEPTALALSHIFQYLAENETQKTVLERFGYLVGRYVYFIDALDDLEEDVETGSYNIFYKKFAAESEGAVDFDSIREYAKGVINLTVGQIAAAYELLELKWYKTILDNIIYLGFHDSLNKVCNRKAEKEKEKNREKNGAAL